VAHLEREEWMLKAKKKSERTSAKTKRRAKRSQGLASSSKTKTEVSAAAATTTTRVATGVVGKAKIPFTEDVSSSSHGGHRRRRGRRHGSHQAEKKSLPTAPAETPTQPRHQQQKHKRKTSHPRTTITTAAAAAVAAVAATKTNHGTANRVITDKGNNLEDLINNNRSLWQQQEGPAATATNTSVASITTTATTTKPAIDFRKKDLVKASKEEELQSRPTDYESLMPQPSAPLPQSMDGEEDGGDDDVVVDVDVDVDVSTTNSQKDQGVVFRGTKESLGAMDKDELIQYLLKIEDRFDENHAKLKAKVVNAVVVIASDDDEVVRTFVVQMCAYLILQLVVTWLLVFVMTTLWSIDEIWALNPWLLVPLISVGAVSFAFLYFGFQEVRWSIIAGVITLCSILLSLFVVHGEWYLFIESIAILVIFLTCLGVYAKYGKCWGKYNGGYVGAATLILILIYAIICIYIPYSADFVHITSIWRKTPPRLIRSVQLVALSSTYCIYTLWYISDAMKHYRPKQALECSVHIYIEYIHLMIILPYLLYHLADMRNQLRRMVNRFMGMPPDSNAAAL